MYHSLVPLRWFFFLKGLNPIKSQWGLSKYTDPLKKILPMNFKFRLNSKRKPFSSRNNPSLKLWWRRIRAFLSPVGKLCPGKQSVVCSCCTAAGAGLDTLSVPRTSPVNNPQQSGADTRAVLLFPTNVPMKLAGVPTSMPLPLGCAAGAGSARAVTAASTGRARGTCSITHQGIYPARTFLPPGDLPHLWLTLLPNTWLYLVGISFVAPHSLNKPEWCFLAKSRFSS